MTGEMGSPPPTGRCDDDRDDDRKWTVMVFMGADAVDGSPPLDEAVESDLAEIDYATGPRALDVFVQVNKSSAPPRRLHYAKRAGTSTLTETTLSQPSRGGALTGFIRDALTGVKHRRKDHSMLVLWGHAYDFAFGRSRTRSGIIDAIDFVELSQMLEGLQDHMAASMGDWKPGDPRPTLDVIGFDVCEVATVELACQLQPFAKYLIGSQIGIPIPGWPYDRILKRLVEPKGRLMVPAEFGAYVVRRFCESYPASSPVSLTMLDLAQAQRLRAHAEVLSLTLASAIGTSEACKRILDLFYRSQTAEDRPFVDVAELCLNLVRDSGDPLVAEAARAMGNLLAGSQQPLAGKSEEGVGRPLIVEHGRNAGELARLNGISLYAPHVAPSNDFDAVRTLYDSFAFAQETWWSRLVHTLARLS
jgi:hypothetical protein